eukprot:953360-Pelagomonas_calceolata.AAC.1
MEGCLKGWAHWQVCCRVPRRLTILGYNSRVSYVVQKGVGAGVPQRIGALTGVQVQSGSKAGECGSRGASEPGARSNFALGYRVYRSIRHPVIATAC